MAKAKRSTQAAAAGISAAQEKELADFFGYLYDRWQDEQGYEDFGDYRAALQKRLPGGAKIAAMSSAPFRVAFVLDGAAYAMEASSKSVAFTRPKPAAVRRRLPEKAQP